MPEGVVVEPVVDAVVAPVVEVVEPVVDDAEPKVYDQAYVEQLRAEAAKHRTEKQAEKARVDDLAAQLKTLQDAQLTEAERQKQEFEETKVRADRNESRANDLQVQYQLALAAVDPANEIGDVNAAIKLIDRDTLEFDSNGKISNLQDALEALKREYPSVVASKNNTPAPNTGVTNPSKRGAEKQITREDLKGMTSERIVALQAEGKLNHLLRGK